MSDEMSWDGQASHGLKWLGYSNAADVSCDELNEAISTREKRVAEIESRGQSDAASEHAQLSGTELPDLRKLATEKGCAGTPN